MATPPDGLISRWLTLWFGRSYRTTIAGIVSVVAAGVAAAPGVSPTVAHWAMVAVGVVQGAGLIVSKDSRVSGTP